MRKMSKMKKAKERKKMKKIKKLKKLLFVFLLASHVTTHASSIVPIGKNNTTLYYKIGGENDFALPPVSTTRTTVLNTNTNLSIGYSCSAYNPALSISNSINDLKNSTDNLEQNIIASATGSLVQLPMYLLAQANPTAYHLLNNTLLSAHKQLDVSTKSCETVKDQIAKGQNPYQDWGTISVNDQWKKHLSFASSGNEDINHSKKEIDVHSGDDGVPWVQGKNDWDSSFHAGGKSQPPIHVIADTVKSGYNTLLNRDLNSDMDAPDDSSSSKLKEFFPNPKSASTWTTNIVGDQIITTCNDDNCKKQQGSLIGHGLLAEMTSCELDRNNKNDKNNKNNCSDSIRDDLSNLVTGNLATTKENLTKVSADGIAISPEIISSIHRMDATQQKILINKLAQEIAMQRVIDKAFMAKTILTTGMQVPVIAANHPAEVIITRAITHLDNDIRALAFESQIRRQTTSDTLSEILKFSNQQEDDAMHTAPVSASAPLMENGAILKGPSQ
jgi:integrating conjugative element protein (TIGR03755 family)